jgi:hypothetical protein
MWLYVCVCVCVCVCLCLCVNVVLWWFTCPPARHGAGFSFCIETPARTYWFQAATSNNQREWVDLLQRVISRYSNTVATARPTENPHSTKMLFSTLSRSFSSSLVARRAAAEAVNPANAPRSPSSGRAPVAESLVVDFDCLQFEERLGAGSFGEVWKVHRVGVQ